MRQVCIYLIFTLPLFSALIGIVNVNQAKVFNTNIYNEKHLVQYYKLGKLFELEYCDKYGWCKINNESLFISSAYMDTMQIPNAYKSIKEILKIKPNIVNKPKTCTKFLNISINENIILDKQTKTDIIKEHLDACIKTKTIKTIIKDVTSYYLKAGYATSRAYLAPQNINSGNLSVDVMLGLIDDIYHENHNLSSWDINMAFAGQKNKPLNLRDLETSLEMMNRVPYIQAKFEILPSSAQKASVIKIKSKRASPVRFSIGTSGSKSFNDNNPTLNTNLYIDNLLNINDILSLGASGPKIQEQYQKSGSYSLKYNFPISSYLIDFGATQTYYASGVKGIEEIYLSNGETKGYSLGISKIISRNQKNKWHISTLINHNDAKNYFQESKIDVSSYATSVLQGTLTHTNYNKYATIASIYTLYKGLNWFGARGDDYIASEIDNKDIAKYEFLKHSLNINLAYKLPFDYFSLSQSGHIQYSEDNLYESDKLSVGTGAVTKGNNVWYFKNTISRDFGISYSYINYIFNKVGLSMLVNYAGSKCEEDNKQVCGEVFGGSFAIKLSRQYFDTSFTWSKPLKQADESKDLESSFSWSFTASF